MAVAQLGMTDIARILAPYSKDVHVQDGYGMTPILWAFKEKYVNDINRSCEGISSNDFRKIMW